jgi:hypothetical protein
MYRERDRIVVDPTHPVWRGIDDDDWSGRAVDQRLSRLKPGMTALVRPKKDEDPKILYLVVMALMRCGLSIELEVPP